MQSVVCSSHTFKNNFQLKHLFTNYLKESCVLYSPEQISLKYFIDFAFVKEISPKTPDRQTDFGCCRLEWVKSHSDPEVGQSSVAADDLHSKPCCITSTTTAHAVVVVAVVVFVCGKAQSLCATIIGIVVVYVYWIGPVCCYRNSSGCVAI